MQSSLVSIIIPTFNRAHLIGETLDSVLVQTYTNWECIVVDDGSTDNTSKVLAVYCKKDTRFQFHHRPNDRLPGGNAARNYGFELSKGEYIQWFDSDDLMNEQLLEKQLANLIEFKKKISVCLFDRYNDDFSILQKKGVKNEIECNAYLDFIRAEIRINLPTTMWHRIVLIRFDLNEELKKSQEYDFIQRVLKKHHSEVVLINLPLVKVRNHNCSITSSFFNGEDEKKIIDSLQVKWEVIKNLPKEVPCFVRKDLLKLFFKALHKVFKFKKTIILLKYLFKLNLLGDLNLSIKTIKLTFIYLIFYFTDKGSAAFKKITLNH